MLILLPLATIFEAARWTLTWLWAWLAVLGAMNVVASLYLYRAFEYGVLSVVSPLASSYPAVTATLAVVFLGDRPGGFATVGIVSILGGILLLSRSRAHPDNPPPRDARVGLVSALVAFAGYGVFYFALAYPVAVLGPVTAAAFARLVGVVLLLAVSGIRTRALRRPPAELWRLLLPIGLLDSLAFIAYNVGITRGSVAIVGTLSGLFSAVTVGLAAFVLRERLTAVQLVGVGAVLSGVVLLAVR